MADPTTIFGMDGSSVILAGAILLSALVGAAVAFFTIGHQRLLARKKVSYDLALSMQRPTVLDCERAFLKQCKKGRWKRIVAAKTSAALAKKRETARYLNHWELVCVSIEQRIVDEGVLKAVIGDKLVRRYSAARPFIHLLRTEEGDDEYFEYFELVAKRWKDYPKPPRRTVVGAVWHQVTRT